MLQVAGIGPIDEYIPSNLRDGLCPRYARRQALAVLAASGCGYIVRLFVLRQLRLWKPAAAAEFAYPPLRE
jgi:hypothetical protein